APAPAHAKPAGAVVRADPRVVVLPPEALVAPSIPSTDPLLDTGRIARVLADLEPVDHSTSFATDDTEIIPLQRQAAPASAGRRRATRQSANPFVRRLPSLPLVAGVAVLGIAVAGTVSTAGTDLADAPTSISQIGAAAATGSSGTGSVRGPVVSRDADRSDLASTVARRNERIASVDKQAAARAADLAANRWGLPVDPSLYHLTARFGEYGLWSSFHTGLDFAAAPGTPIHAIAAGTVTFTGYDGAYGNKTVVTLPDGTELWYCHQTSIEVSVGDEVASGQEIGTVGSTGHVTGPHVHIEVRPGGGDPVDPYAAMVAHGVTP
ncbi:M23 family metallopeptidase, partial [Nocardioides fonticola]|uniref:M23 family metallopeptidase n=1 Tax=Nocardioides fonticola TaxID=450363 RepID=UPI0031DABEAA